MPPPAPTTCQETVKQADITLNVSVTPLMLKNLRHELSQSLTEFGATLKAATSCSLSPSLHPRPYTRQYISRLEHGLDPITPQLAAAFWNIAAALDDVPAGLGGAVTASILAQPGQVPANAYLPLTAKAVRCSRPGCKIIFLQTHPRQRYHHPDCRKKAISR